jgi:hypothetical protein
MLGFLDAHNPTVAGWLFCDENPELVPIIDIFLDEILIFQIPADLLREDVKKIIGLYNRGFSVDINEFTIPNKNHTLKIISNFPTYFDFGTFSICGISKVEIGRDGWLFLVNDSNSTDIKIQSDSKLFENDINANVAQFYIRQQFFLRHELNHFSVLIPDRSIICNDKRSSPLNISPTRPGVVFSEKIISSKIRNFIYPIEDFIDKKSFIFYKTDTHLNILGYLNLFNLISAYIPLFSNAFSEFLIIENDYFRGDLSLHSASNYSEKILELNHSLFNEIIFFDNVENSLLTMAKLTGSTVRAFNPNAKFGKIYITGTSSAYYSVRLLSLIFKEVYFEWGIGINFKSILDFQPDLFLWFGVERFLPFNISDQIID